MKSPGLKSRILLAVIGLACAGTSALPQQNPSDLGNIPPYKVNVRLVNVFVNVTDEEGAPVGGLKQSDFVLTEDGVPQKIAFFERQTDMPLSLVLAIDTSGSVQKDLELEKHAAHDFLRALVRPVDSVDLIDFNSDVREVVPFTADLRRLDAGLSALSTGPATALYNAIYLGAQALAPRHGRKVLVVITDGGNTIDGVTYDQALDQAIRSEVMVYSLIDLPILNDAGRDTGGEHALMTLSQGTGGKYYYAQFGNLAQAFAQVSEDLRTQYLIGYYPLARRSSSEFRKIQVSLKPGSTPHAGSDVLRYRPGYYAPASPPLDQ